MIAGTGYSIFPRLVSAPCDASGHSPKRYISFTDSTQGSMAVGARWTFEWGDGFCFEATLQYDAFLGPGLQGDDVELSGWVYRNIVLMILRILAIERLSINKTSSAQADPGGRAHTRLTGLLGSQPRRVWTREPQGSYYRQTAATNALVELAYIVEFLPDRRGEVFKIVKKRKQVQIIQHSMSK